MLFVGPSRESAFFVGITLLSFAACSSSTDGGGTSNPTDAAAAAEPTPESPGAETSSVVRIALGGPASETSGGSRPVDSHTASGVVIQRPVVKSVPADSAPVARQEAANSASTTANTAPSTREPEGATKAITAAATAASPVATSAATNAQPGTPAPKTAGVAALPVAPAPVPRNASLVMPTVRIEGGVFDEEPIASFELDQTEVTVAMYDACVQAGRCTPPAPAEDGKIGRAHCTYGRVGFEVTPVNCVTPLDADAFCAYAGKRLPSEEEWEWAAAGREDDRRFVWGSGYGIPEGVCWKRKAEGPCDVGISSADVTRDGVKDMAGNVQEWTTSTLEGRRVGRGGSWYADFGVALQIATFVSGDGSSRSDLVGFRCARSLD